MHKTKHIMIIAGEESGDIHSARLVNTLKQHHPNLHFSGIGGEHMAQAGVDVVHNLSQYGITGFSEIFMHLWQIMKAFRITKSHLRKTKPDLLVLVDYPGFNLRIARFAKQKLGLRILYYISPQIWAWKENRVHTIKATIDRMATIFPFEEKLYHQWGIAATFVGHPLISNDFFIKKKPHKNTLSNLSQEKKIVAILPGSRINELKRHLPIIRKTIVRLNQEIADLYFVFPVAKAIGIQKFYTLVGSLPSNCSVIEDNAQEIMQNSHLCIVASGTASLECALLKKPMCIIYKGSLLTYMLASKLIKVKYIGLCNLLLDRMAVPELIQYDCSVNNLFDAVKMMLTDTSYRTKMQTALKALVSLLAQESASQSLENVIMNELKAVESKKTVKN